MTAKVIALYGAPKDAAAFNEYYFAKHVPLAKTLPGLAGYEVSTGGVNDIGGQPAYHLAATLTFASLDDIQSALTSPVGVATAGDLANFATGGVNLLVFESREI